MSHPFFAFLFQADAAAGQAAPPAGGQAPPPSLFDPISLVPILGCIVVFWVFMIAPERKQRKKREEMLKNLKKGDEVVTSSGLYGSIVQVHEGVVTLQVADGVRMRFAQSSIGSVNTPEPATTKS
jgi:preprotein translocase subunit YajC